MSEQSKNVKWTASGSLVAIVTPMTEGGSIDFPAFDKLVEWHIQSGTHGIVVVGTTGDPATPLASTRKMAAALEQGILLIVEANQHTGYGANGCINTAIDSYLIDLTLPVNETTCKS